MTIYDPRTNDTENIERGFVNEQDLKYMVTLDLLSKPTIVTRETLSFMFIWFF